jgi:hypothetical protein
LALSSGGTVLPSWRHDVPDPERRCTVYIGGGVVALILIILLLILIF